MLLVANGKTLTFIDYDVGQKSSWPIAKSPLGGAAVGPARPQAASRRIVPSERSAASSSVRARDARRPEFGTLILAFLRSAGAPGGLQLDGWTAIDAQNKTTTVKLSNQRYNVAVPTAPSPIAEPKRKRSVAVSNRNGSSLATGYAAYIDQLDLHRARGFPLLPGSCGDRLA